MSTHVIEQATRTTSFESRLDAGLEYIRPQPAMGDATSNAVRPKSSLGISESEPSSRATLKARQSLQSSEETSRVTIIQTLLRVSSTQTATVTLHGDFPSSPPAKSSGGLTDEKLGIIIGSTCGTVLVLLLVGCWLFRRRGPPPRSLSRGSLSPFPSPSPSLSSSSPRPPQRSSRHNMPRGPPGVPRPPHDGDFFGRSFPPPPPPSGPGPTQGRPDTDTKPSPDFRPLPPPPSENSRLPPRPPKFPESSFKTSSNRTRPPPPLNTDAGPAAHGHRESSNVNFPSSGVRPTPHPGGSKLPPMFYPNFDSAQKSSSDRKSEVRTSFSNPIGPRGTVPSRSTGHPRVPTHEPRIIHVTPKRDIPRESTTIHKPCRQGSYSKQHYSKQHYSKQHYSKQHYSKQPEAVKVNEPPGMRSTTTKLERHHQTPSSTERPSTNVKVTDEKKVKFPEVAEETFPEIPKERGSKMSDKKQKQNTTTSQSSPSTADDALNTKDESKPPNTDDSRTTTKLYGSESSSSSSSSDDPDDQVKPPPPPGPPGPHPAPKVAVPLFIPFKEPTISAPTVINVNPKPPHSTRRHSSSYRHKDNTARTPHRSFMGIPEGEPNNKELRYVHSNHAHTSPPVYHRYTRKSVKPEGHRTDGHIVPPQRRRSGLGSGHAQTAPVEHHHHRRTSTTVHRSGQYLRALPLPQAEIEQGPIYYSPSPVEGTPQEAEMAMAPEPQQPQPVRATEGPPRRQGGWRSLFQRAGKRHKGESSSKRRSSKRDDR